jgi:hypothetical protein
LFFVFSAFLTVSCFAMKLSNLFGSFFCKIKYTVDVWVSFCSRGHEEISPVTGFPYFGCGITVGTMCDVVQNIEQYSIPLPILRPTLLVHECADKSPVVHRPSNLVGVGSNEKRHDGCPSLSHHRCS